MTETWTYNPDGTLHELDYNGIAGQKYTSTDTLYGSNGKAVSELWTNGATTIQSETWNTDGTIHDIHYYGITGQAYTDYDVAYGANNKAGERQLLQRHDRDVDVQPRQHAVRDRL